MKIPHDAVIAEEKLTQYLLVQKQNNDKSKFLAKAGFTPDNPEKLEAAIRALANENDAVEEKTTEYGTAYHVRGELEGVNQRRLEVMLVWFRRDADQRFYFVTLMPG